MNATQGEHATEQRLPDNQVGDVTSPESAGLRDAVVAEQLRVLSRKRVDLPINLVNAAIVSATFWRFYPCWLVPVWLALFSGVILARFLIRRSYSLAAPKAGAARRWGRIFTVNAFATACMWGLTGTVILVTPDPIYHLFIVFVLGGMMAGSIVSNGAYKPAMFAFLVPTIVPVIAILLTRNDLVQKEMGIMLTAFAAVLIVAGRNINESIVENFRLRIGQDMLLVKLRASEAAMAEAQAISHVGSWETELRSCTDTWSRETYRIFGVDPATFKPSFETVLPRIHPDDRPAIAEAHAQALSTGIARETGYRLTMDDGTIKHIRQLGQVTSDATGDALRINRTLQDVSVQKRGEAAAELLAAIVDCSLDAIVGETVTGTITSWNRGAESLFGYSAHEAIGQSIRLIVPEDRGRELDENLRRVVKGEPIEPFDTERLRKDGRRVPVSIAVSLLRGDQTGLTAASFIARDITERVKAGEALAYRDRLLHAVTVGTGILVKSASLELGMPAALRILGESMRVDRVLLMREGPTPTSPPALDYVWESPGAQTAAGNWAAWPASPTYLGELTAWRARMSEGQPLIAQLANSEGAVRAMLEYAGNQSTLLVPILVDGRMWGSLGIDSCSAAREWTASETDTMMTFGDIAGSLLLRNENRLSLERSEERFRALSATAQDAIITLDGAARISFWNSAAERILGYSEAEAMGKPVHELLAPVRYREQAALGTSTFLATGEGGAVGKTTEMAAIRKDGAEIAIELSLAGARLGGERQAVGILRDITERKRVEDGLQFANILLKTQMEASPDGILIVDANKAIISFNQRLADLWAIPLEDLVAGRDDVVLAKVLLGVKDPQAFLERVHHLYAHPGEDSHDEFETTDGRSIDRYTATLNGPGGAYLGRIWFFRDVTARKTAEAQALRMARQDGLTGLANRSVFVEALEQAVSRAKRGGPGFAVIYLDLDHFKDVNDTLGHPAGDALLQAVADRLRSNTRSSDTVARFGGDEFAVVVGNVSDPADAAILADKLIGALAGPYSVLGNQIYSGASIGIDLYGPGALDAETLLSHADVALYRAKAEGRGSYRFFTDAMDKEVRTRVSLGTELHEALASGQLFLLYQPQIAIETGKITGVESLVRWRHPARGILGPDLFVPVAERLGIIGKLGHWVLSTACRDARARLDSGLPPIRTCVNLSALQSRSPVSLEMDISAILAETGLPAGLLELELTETLLLDTSREPSDVIPRLRELGVTIAIDDFGTGYSSLDYLRRFPVDRIKIAQTFVGHLESVSGEVAIVKAIIGLARELGIAVIAEGVETKAQFELLKSWGCTEAQGFYIARPMLREDVTLLLRAGGILQPEGIPVGGAAGEARLALARK